MNNYKLINGDCIKEMEKMIMNNVQVELIVTSPPYFNVKEYSHYETYEDYLNWLQEVFNNAFQILKNGRMCAVNISNIIIPRKKRQEESRRLPLAFHLIQIMEDIGFKFLEDIIWVKPNGSVPNRNGGFYRNRKPIAYKPNCINEYIFIFQKPTDKLIDDILKQYPQETIDHSLVTCDYEKTNIWHINPSYTKKHPATYPIELTDKIIKYYTFVGDTVLDPFMGSGTTGVTCLQTNRNFIGIEKVEKYYDIAKQRINEAKAQRRLI